MTNRERQVAELAAEGRSAKDIARQLAIGHRTVETHLAHAYEKLGIGSRAELILMRDGKLAAVKDKNDSERFTHSRR